MWSLGLVAGVELVGAPNETGASASAAVRDIALMTGTLISSPAMGILSKKADITDKT